MTFFSGRREALTALVALLLLPACTTSRPYVAEPFQDWEAATPPSEADVAYRAFLVGCTGAVETDGSDPVLSLLKDRLDAAGDESVVAFLGDNVYCCGLRDSTAEGRARDEARLRAQLDAVKDAGGRVVFVPGNHDWDDGSPEGLEAIRRMEAYVEAYLDQGNTFLPDDGFPGPVEVELDDGLTLVVLDTQWWLHPHEKPFGDAGDYTLDEDLDFLLQLEDILARRDDDNLLVVGHHPVFSSGSHAGFFPLRSHLFPLTELYDWAYLPLPVVGSLPLLYGRYFGFSRQDNAHSRFRALREGLTRVFSTHERLVYAAAHEHVLQYFPLPGSASTQHYLVSGGGSRPSPVAPGNGAAFAASTLGFSEITYYDDGAAWLTFWEATGDGAGTVLFRAPILEPQPERIDLELPAGAANGFEGFPDYRDSTVVAAANPDYAAGPVRQFFLGRHHRALWATPVEAPVLDLGRTEGGLTPVRRGGGQQTISLRLENPDGKTFVLRSIDKDPAKTVPRSLQGTVATDIVQDQIASLHPYGALVIPPLASAAGLYHTNPRVVFVPDDPRLGPYRERFAGELMLFEERPDDDESDAPSFGRSEDVVGEGRLYRELNADNDHRVDQHAFARARLFDMWIADWDRHRGQWRWASFEPYELDPTLEGEARTEGKIYRPIPVDRDWAFNHMTGLPELASFFDTKFQDFEAGYGNLRGLNSNALEQDRRLTNALSRSDWLALADTLQAALTDRVIEAAVEAWPEAIYEQNGAHTIRLLKERRAQLDEVAADYYDLLAGTVDVVGSDRHERFEVTRLDDDSTRVVVYKTSREGEIRREIYRRTFLHDETDEIRLFGLDGRDQFIVDGEVGESPEVLAIGGAGEDRFVDRSRVAGWNARTHFFDSAKNNTWEPGPETEVTRSDDPAVNVYDPFDFRFDLTKPILFFGSNTDDGVFLGGGVDITRHGFRKDPFAQEHLLMANFAARTAAFNVLYQGTFTEALGPWDVLLDARWLAPGNIRNFYGLGNDTEDTDRDAEFFETPIQEIVFAPALARILESGLLFRVGPTFEFVNLDREESTILDQPLTEIEEIGAELDDFEDQLLVGGELSLDLASLDRLHNPRRGLRWSNSLNLNVGIRNSDDSYTALRSDFMFYASPRLEPQATLALRVGVAHNVGDFPFYRASTLGGRENLRGYRSTRFAGRTSFYQNAELRLELFEFSTYLAIGELGVLGFFDSGRVWTDDEDSADWHPGYGGGLWLDLFDAAVLTGWLGTSDEETTFTLQLGFQY